LAVIGAGRLGRFHAQKAAAREDVALIGVADPAAGQRQRVAAECGCRAVADYRHLLGEIDGAIVAAPTFLHHKIGLDLLANGIHVLLEKPLAPTAGEAQDLVNAAAANRVVLQVGHVERFNPAFAASAAHLHDAKYIEAVRAGGFTFRSTDVGVVLDLMIHDIDLVLSLVRSPIRRVDAIGFSILGGHEDVASARVAFENGTVASLNASRVSYDPVRRMSVWTSRAFSAIDFASRTTSVIRPSEALLRRQFDVDSLSAEEIDHYREHFLEDHLPCENLQSEPIDALAAELDDFVESLRMPRQPRVTGEHGAAAVELAERVLAEIDSHCWTETADGPVGPHAIRPPSIIPGPHWRMTPSQTPAERKEAG
jgi:predicted dehydrogenase